MKASWTRVILNMQLVITFLFDIFIAKIKFNQIEIVGAICLLTANFYLLFYRMLTKRSKIILPDLPVKFSNADLTGRHSVGGYRSQEDMVELEHQMYSGKTLPRLKSP
jgi:hypothetical protein